MGDVNGLQTKSKNTLSRIFGIGQLLKIGRRLSLIAMVNYLVLSLGASLAFAAEEQSTATPPPTTTAKAAILIEATTGQVLYAFNENELRDPASMVKMMTEYLVLESIANGQTSWDTEVTISEYAAGMIGSGVRLAVGHRYTVKDLFRQMSIYSSNYATVALAEHVGGGTEDAFVRMMNDKAREFGLSNGAIFVNSTGLPKSLTGKYTTSIEGESLFTAHDSAIIAQRLILDYPEVLEFTQIPRAHLVESNPNSELMDNWNRMLESWKGTGTLFESWAYDGADGLKTGHTDDAGWCFTGTAERDGLRLISVVMGTGNERERFDETKKLLDYGFNNFEKKTILPAKSSIDAMPEIEVSKGVETKVPVTTETGVVLLVKKGTTVEQFEISAAPLDKNERIAPLQKGDVLGTATLKYTGTDQAIADIQVNLVAAEDVEKAGWLRLFFRAIKDFFVDLFNSIKNLF